MNIRPYLDFLPQFKQQSYIDEHAIVIGQVTIAEDASLWPGVIVRGDVNHISIGARSNIQDLSMLHVSRPTDDHLDGFPLYIEEDVTIGHQVMLHGCHIKDRVLIGMGSIIMDGVLVEKEVMLGAGSFVAPNKVLESGFLYFGSPAKKIRPLTDQERISLKTSAEHYVNLKNNYLNMRSNR